MPNGNHENYEFGILYVGDYSVISNPVSPLARSVS